MASVDYRKKLATLMRAILKDEQAHGTWTYRAVRPMPVPPSWKAGQHVVGDCSKGAQYINRWLGLDDPMGEDFGPWGNSQTLCMRLQHLDHPSELLVGDIVTFGKNGEEHATRVLEAGDDPLLWSFGHQGAPNAYRLSQDHRPAQYLRVPLPKYVPTTVERLRSRTGWFAWMAWKLGEGDWAGRGPANRTVRPAVPKVIPPSWWTRYAKFLAARNKANRPTTSNIGA